MTLALWRLAVSDWKSSHPDYKGRQPKKNSDEYNQIRVIYDRLVLENKGVEAVDADLAASKAKPLVEEPKPAFDNSKLLDDLMKMMKANAAVSTPVSTPVPTPPNPVPIEVKEEVIVKKRGRPRKIAVPVA